MASPSRSAHGGKPSNCASHLVVCFVQRKNTSCLFILKTVFGKFETHLFTSNKQTFKFGSFQGRRIINVIFF